MAAPLVFSSEVVRVRPQERTPKDGEEEEEEERKRKKKVMPKSGFFRRRSSGGGGKDHGTSCTAALAESGPPPASPNLGAGEEGRSRSSSGSGWFGRSDSKERKPSSHHPGLLVAAATASAAGRELPGEPPSSPPEDHHGPPPSEDQEPGPQSTTSAPEAPAAAVAGAAPSEWDDSFDAFATSRLRPPLDGVAQEDPLDGRGPPEPGRGLLPCSQSRPQGHEEPRLGGPDLLGFVSEQREPLGGRGVGRLTEEASSHVAWPPQEGLARPGLAQPREPMEEETPRELVGGSGSPGGEERPETPQAMAAGVPSRGLESSVVGSQRAHVPTALTPSAAGEGRRLLVGPADEGQPKEPPEAPPVAQGSRQPPEVGVWETPVAGVCLGDLEREEEAPSPKEAALKTGHEEDAEMEEEEEEGERAAGSQGQQRKGGVCEARRTETPPPKPPRRFTPLSLQEEAQEALRPGWERWQGGAALCDEEEADEGPRPPSGEGSSPPRAAPKAIIGAIEGGGRDSVPRATEILRLAADPAGANEPRGREASSGDTVPSASEEATGTKGFQTCPLPELSLDGPSLEGACSGSFAGTAEGTPPLGLAEPGSLEVTQMLPWPREGAGRPSRTLSPSGVFWSALEEQRLLPSEDPPLPAPPEERGLPRQEDGDAQRGNEVGQDGSHFSHASGATTPYPESFVPSKGHEGASASKSEASSSWSDDQVMDFKRADFWQSDRRERSQDTTPMTPGNPFAPRLAPWPPPFPSPQNNPFMEQPPDLLPSQAAVLNVFPSEGPRPRDPQTAPQGLLFPSGAPSRRGPQPLAFSTPSVQGVPRSSEISLPSPVGGPAAAEAPPAPSQPSTEPSAPSVLSPETWREEEAPPRGNGSPHPVKPISSGGTAGPTVATRKKEEEEGGPATCLTPTRIKTGQEKLRSGPGSTGDDNGDDDDAAAAPTLQLGKTEAKRDPSDHAAKYYHLTHDELIHLLQKREAELSKEKEHVRELENYIDRLLVRIMEQSPTLLQISRAGEARAAK